MSDHRYPRYSYIHMHAGHAIRKWLHGSSRNDTRETISNNGDVLIKSAVVGEQHL